MNSLLVTSVLDMLLAGLLGKIPNFNDNGDGNSESDDESYGDDDNDADYEDLNGVNVNVSTP